MTRIRPFAIGFALFLTLAMASLARAQDNRKDSYSGAVTGSITAVDAKSITIKGDDGNDGGTFAMSADTQVMSEGKTITSGGLKPGDHVAVSWDYTEPGSKDKIAQLIEMADAPK